MGNPLCTAILTDIFGGLGGITQSALEQGAIIGISSWGFPGAGHPLIIGAFSSSGKTYNGGPFGTGAIGLPCDPFILTEQLEFINGYEVYYTDFYITGLTFFTSAGNEHSCITNGGENHDSQKQTFGNDRYLTGWKMKTGSLIDSIQFQFKLRQCLDCHATFTDTYGNSAGVSKPTLDQGRIAGISQWGFNQNGNALIIKDFNAGSLDITRPCKSFTVNQDDSITGFDIYYDTVNIHGLMFKTRNGNNYDCFPVSNPSTMNWQKESVQDNTRYLIGFTISSLTAINSMRFQFKETKCIRINIFSCKNWAYSSTTNTMQMQFMGSQGASKLFYVNEYAALPINNKDESYYIDYMSGLGNIYSISLSVNDKYGYCMRGINIDFQQSIHKPVISYNFPSTKYFGSGIVLSNTCGFSYRYLSPNVPMIRCISDRLQLNVDSKRGIYKLGIHSCISAQSDISSRAMKNNLYAVIMGKLQGINSYSATSISFLDHYIAGDINLHLVGNLIAGNTQLQTSGGNTVYSEIEGQLIGIKVEVINGDSNEIFTVVSSLWDYLATHLIDNVADLFQVSVANVAVTYTISSSFENYKYFIRFFQPVSITKSTAITVTALNTGGNTAISYTPTLSNPFTDPRVKINIYAILQSQKSLYQLPFKVIMKGTNTNWFDANTECQKKYGTSLAAVQSETEQFLIHGLLSRQPAWIGLHDLSVLTQNTWGWTDGSALTYNSWATGNPTGIGTNDCVQMSTNKGEWNNVDCRNAVVQNFICASPQWGSDTWRQFELNIDQYLPDVTMLSIGNNAAENLCIDAISVDDKAARYISNNWISTSSTSTASSLRAVFKYPVCKTELTSMRIDYDSSVSKLSESESIISGLECINNNRIISTTCDIKQEYSFSKTTSFSILSEQSTTSAYSWGTSKALTLTDSTTNSQSQSTTDEFSWGLSQSINVGAEAEIGAVFARATASINIEVGANQQWTSTNERSTSFERSNGQESTSEQSKGGEESDTNTNGHETSYETSDTVTIECAGSVEVPPSHSLSYSLMFAEYNTTITTYTDLKLTLCSAFLSPSAINSEDNYVVIKDIPGVLGHREVTACTIQFQPAKYVDNKMKCEEEKKLAISKEIGYTPRCKDDGSYDGCQCQVGGETGEVTICWCVDASGNPIDTKTMTVKSGTSFEQVCIGELRCGNSEVGALVSSLSRSSFSWLSNHPSCNGLPSNSNQHNAWCSNLQGEVDTYVQVNLGSIHAISAVATYGRACCDQYVTQYNLQYSIDGTTFISIGVNNPLNGNVDATSRALNKFDANIIAQYLKFIPVTFHLWQSMRVEAYGYQLTDSQSHIIPNIGHDVNINEHKLIDNIYDYNALSILILSSIALVITIIISVIGVCAYWFYNNWNNCNKSDNKYQSVKQFESEYEEDQV
eukprot:506012_1